MDSRKFHHALLRAYMTPIWDVQPPESVTVSLSHWDGFKDYWVGERGATVTYRDDGTVESPFEKATLRFVHGLPDDIVIVPGLGAPLSQFLES
jgi:hypothetical protein